MVRRVLYACKLPDLLRGDIGRPRKGSYESNGGIPGADKHRSCLVDPACSIRNWAHTICSAETFPWMDAFLDQKDDT